MSRLFAVTLLTLALLNPAFGEHANAKTPVPRDLGGPTIADFAGKWSNENPNTGIITHIFIDQQFDVALVHAWSKCRPTDCDWGISLTQSAEADNGSLDVEWEYRSSVRRVNLTLRGSDRLQVKTKVHFSNDSGRSDYDVVDYLIRTPEEASGSTDGYSPSSGLPVPRISAAEVEKAHQSRESIELCINDCHGSAKWRCRISDAYQDCVQSVDCMNRIAVAQTVDWVLDFRLCHGWYDTWEQGM